MSGHFPVLVELDVADLTTVFEMCTYTYMYAVLGRHTNKPPSSTRHPLQLVSELSPDEKLARLAQENQELSGVGRGKAYRDDSGEVISELLDHMMLQQSAEREIEKQQCNK